MAFAQIGTIPNFKSKTYVISQNWEKAQNILGTFNHPKVLKVEHIQSMQFGEKDAWDDK